MRKLWLTLAFLALSWGMTACWKNFYPDKPGTLFIRQQICDLSDFKTRFFRPPNDLKDRGFLAYRFYRDINDPKTYLLVFDCANLKKAVEFIQSSNFIVACVGAGLGTPVMWAGVEKSPSLKQDSKARGLMVARYEASNGDVLENGDDTGRWYELSTGLIETRAVLDVYRTREVMESKAEKEKRKMAGVTDEQFWWGRYLEDGTSFTTK